MATRAAVTTAAAVSNRFNGTGSVRLSMSTSYPAARIASTQPASRPAGTTTAGAVPVRVVGAPSDSVIAVVSSAVSIALWTIAL